MTRRIAGGVPTIPAPVADHQPNPRPLRKAELPAVPARAMRAHRSTDGLDVGEGNALVAEPSGFLDEFLGMACPAEERMVASDKQLTPPA